MLLFSCQKYDGIELVDTKVFLNELNYVVLLDKYVKAYDYYGDSVKKILRRGDVLKIVETAFVQDNFTTWLKVEDKNGQVYWIKKFMLSLHKFEIQAKEESESILNG